MQEATVDSDQFDALVSRLSNQLTRRRSLGLLGAAGAAGVGLVTDAEAKKKKHKKKRKKTSTTQPPTTPKPTTTLPPAGSVEISQVYTHGGESQATYDRDYIELLNRSSQAINVGDWSVQVSGASSPNWSVIPLTGVVLQPHEYLLIAAHSGSGGNPLPGFDISSTVSVPSGGGRIAVVASPSALSCGADASCVTAQGVIDFLGYGAGTSAEGGAPATPLPGVTQALFRGSAGCAETNNNGADFSVAAALPHWGMTQVCP
jgi:hypothetical protein